MKNYFFLLLIILFQQYGFAQKENNQGSLRNFIQEIVRSAAEDFADIKGTQIGGEPGTIQFLSLKEIPGSIENKVIGYSGLKKTDWVWESKLNYFEKIEDLQVQYKKVYKEISKGSVKSNAKTYEPLGEYEQPTEEQRIWTNQFRVVNTKIMIDLVAEQQNYEWVIYLRIYNLDNLGG
jgi:hypothetical protein